jgi:hypothetical protein
MQSATSWLCRSIALWWDEAFCSLHTCVTVVLQSSLQPGGLEARRQVINQARVLPLNTAACVRLVLGLLCFSNAGSKHGAATVLWRLSGWPVASHWRFGLLTGWCCSGYVHVMAMDGCQFWSSWSLICTCLHSDRHSGQKFCGAFGRAGARSFHWTLQSWRWLLSK